MIDLFKYCYEEVDRAALRQPFIKNEMAYATDGHIAIRIPKEKALRLDECSSEAFYQSMFNTAEKIIEEAKQSASIWVKLVGLPEHEPCKACPEDDQPGEKVCFECNGDGEVTVEGEFNSYDVLCANCEGAGAYHFQHWCRICHGTKIHVNSRKFIGCYFEGNLLNLHLLALIRDLPGIQIGLRAAGRLDAHYFKFEYGDGVIMPMRLDPNKTYTILTHEHFEVIQ